MKLLTKKIRFLVNEKENIYINRQTHTHTQQENKKTVINKTN